MGPVDVTPQWRTLTLDMPNVSGDTRIHLRFQSPDGAEVNHRQVRLDAVRLKSAPVPFADGTPLGGLVLGAAPSPAERNAAYELQRFIHRMTGKTPGIEGRDKSFEGRTIRVGSAVGDDVKARLEGLPPDACLLHTDDRVISLAGNTGLGTLYAVYDFLEKQGCYWVMPGEVGEVIPERKALLPVEDRIESPDYRLVRALGTSFQQLFNPGGGPEMGWIYHDIDEQLDWIVRNRLNAYWTGGPTYDLGADRGHGWIQNSGHSFNATIAPYHKYFETHRPKSGAFAPIRMTPGLSSSGTPGNRTAPGARSGPPPTGPTRALPITVRRGIRPRSNACRILPRMGNSSCTSARSTAMRTSTWTGRKSGSRRPTWV